MYFKITPITLLFFGLTVCGQSFIENHPKVKVEKQTIDLNDSLKTIVLENEAFLEELGDGGGELKGFYNQFNQLKKIETTLYKSWGVQEYSYYIKNEILFLVVDEFKKFAFNTDTNTFNYSKYDGGFQGIYIFENSKLLDYTSLGHNRFEDDQIDAETIFLAEFDSYYKILKVALSQKQNK